MDIDVVSPLPALRRPAGEGREGAVSKFAARAGVFVLLADRVIRQAILLLGIVG